MKEFAIIGGGIGGCATAALLNVQGHNVVLLEKEPYLGGCASTFSHRTHRYNTGATTISGCHEDGVVKALFDKVGVRPRLIPTDPGIVIIQGRKQIARYSEIEHFLSELQQAHPHPGHSEFWHLVQSICEAFYTMQMPYYSNASVLKKVISLFSFSPLLKKFWPYLHGNARAFIEEFYKDVTPEYRDFLDAQIMIVAQDSSEKVNFFTAALALGYTFKQTHYPLGGMGNVCDTLTSKLKDRRSSCEVNKVERRKDRYLLHTAKEIIEAENIIMGTSHYESKQWFEDKQITSYYKRYEKRNNHQSAFVLYLRLRSHKSFHHHYQLIAKEKLPYTLSKALFVSFSDPADTQMSADGHYSITASIHTDTRFWSALEPFAYKAQKKSLQELLKTWICDTLCIDFDDIVDAFSATPHTFGRYLNRTQLGGNALNTDNLLPFLPSNDTPIAGFYQVGDTAYAAQGWPGVVMGAMNLSRLLNDA
ncbi:MAG: NAD(P)-binding protein [Campylobacterales bacterium]|nr:NAD(P)-binding protein [Campylobacterales bacterium]